MNARSLPRKKTVEELKPANLKPLPMTEKDWEEFGYGVGLFNSGKFWHAHEAWEQIWKRHSEDSRMFLQGLILTAAACHTLVEKRRYTGTLNNFEKALPRLRLFEPEFMGVRVTPLLRAINQCRDQVRMLGHRALNSFNLKLLPKLEWKHQE